MAAWTPTDLTNSSFVATQLSDKDRSTALYSVTNELNSAESRFKEQGSLLETAQNAANNGPSRGQINALKAISNDPSRSPVEREQAAQQAANLADERDKLNIAAENALKTYNSTREYVDTLLQGQSNLLQAGAVPPGVNQFAAPPGYEGRSSPAQEVPNSQNPNVTPSALNENLQSSSPELVTGPTSAPYDELNNLNPGWGLDENNRPVWVKEGYIEATGENISDQKSGDTNYRNNYPEAQSDPYDELGNLNPGWNVDEFNTPYWVGFGEIQSKPKTVDDSTGTPYDDGGNLNPGWNVDELGTPYWVGGDFVAPATKKSADESVNKSKGISTAESKLQSSATNEAAVSFEKAKDWRVRLSLAPSAKYLYNADNPGILQPLAATKGVIFPYTPAVSVVYAANYDASELVHSNYKIYNYKNSSVDTVSITCDFTAQDTTEASYLLAVIHFFKSVTKMFYGRDENPRNGTPPPLCYMSGLGTFQFDNHPLVITNFTYTLPNDVDYIRAGSQTNEPGNSTARQTTPVNKDSASASRMQSSGLGSKVPNFQRQAETINSNATYVPTKMQIAITCIPIVTRNDISNRFSLKDYATGKLMQGSKNNGGGIW